MVQEHRFDAKNNVHVYEFCKVTEKEFKFRGIIPSFNNEDILRLGPSLGFKANTDFKFKEVLSVQNSKGVFANPKDGQNSLIEAICEQI